MTDTPLEGLRSRYNELVHDMALADPKYDDISDQDAEADEVFAKIVALAKAEAVEPLVHIETLLTLAMQFSNEEATESEAFVEEALAEARRASEGTERGPS